MHTMRRTRRRRDNIFVAISTLRRLLMIIDDAVVNIPPTVRDVIARLLFVPAK
jgi:hypothetical protein